MTIHAETATAQAAAERQPRSLWTLSWTELWERFSFYGIQVILAYYIYYTVAEGGLGMSEGEALAITGAYGGAVYLSQPLGAWIADRVVPARTMVAAGAAIVMTGHIVLALTTGLGGLLAGLGLITIGTGALFPNILAMMNYLYERGQSKLRDIGFSIYYTGILLGAFAGPMVTGWLQASYGFHVAFSAAAFGMLLALAGYFFGFRKLPEAATRIPNPLTQRAGVRAALLIGAAVLIVIALVFLGVITTSNLNNYVVGAALLVSIGYFIAMHRSPKVTPAERTQVARFVPYFITAVVAWTLILQLFTTFAIYADTRVDLVLGPISVPAAYISVFQVFTGIIAGPLLARAWHAWDAQRGGSPLSPEFKLTVGMILMALTYVVFAIFPMVFAGLVPLIAVILGMIMLGIGEVSFAPLFFSAAGEHAPKAFNAQMMALAGLSLSLGASLSGYIGQVYLVMNESAFFFMCAALAAACGALMYITKPASSRVTAA